MKKSQGKLKKIWILYLKIEDISVETKQNKMQREE